jgi:predicted pyridoxine 5'-phosphate oxidase superfamily flavin-nucleotide-binding protein
VAAVGLAVPVGRLAAQPQRTTMAANEKRALTFVFMARAMRATVHRTTNELPACLRAIALPPSHGMPRTTQFATCERPSARAHARAGRQRALSPRRAVPTRSLDVPKGKTEDFECTQHCSRDEIGESERGFIERVDMFFVATADAEGRPNCSYKGGAPGFVRVVDARTIAFPSYDGNGMYLSMGNLAQNHHVGVLFIDFERGNRVRVNGTASIDENDPLMSEYPEAQLIVRVRVREIFPNCPHYDAAALPEPHVITVAKSTVETSQLSATPLVLTTPEGITASIGVFRPGFVTVHASVGATFIASGVYALTPALETDLQAPMSPVTKDGATYDRLFVGCASGKGQ